MNILIITAHPSSQGFTHKIAEHYKKGAEKRGNRVETLNLYRTDLKQNYLSFENKRVWPYNEVRITLQEKLRRADEWVFVFPIWWSGAPAILKNFIDMNLTSGFGFKYVNGKPLKLLRGKTARVFTTCDGPVWMYQLSQIPKMIWKVGILGFCGVKLKSFKTYGRKDRQKGLTLKKVERMA